MSNLGGVLIGGGMHSSSTIVCTVTVFLCFFLSVNPGISLDKKINYQVTDLILLNVKSMQKIIRDFEIMSTFVTS